MDLKMNIKIIILILVLVIKTNIAFTNEQINSNHEVTTVPFVELDKYLGKWFEISSIPQFFQRKCESNVTAEYFIDSEKTIKVVNSCDEKDGARKIAEGRARIEDSKTNAKLKVTFVKFFRWIYAFGGDYWVIDLAPDYRYAVVGHPSREYAWILSRIPNMDEKDLISISNNLVNQGYDLCKLMTSKQTGGLNIKVPLCEYVKGKL